MKLLIVDDHPLFRDGLAALLRQASIDVQVLQATCAEEALGLADEQIFDAVFMDLMMPGLCGEPAIREFARRHPDLPVIVLSSSESPGDVRRVINAGASGYIGQQLVRRFESAGHPCVCVRASRLNHSPTGFGGSASGDTGVGAGVSPSTEDAG